MIILHIKKEGALQCVFLYSHENEIFFKATFVKFFLSCIMEIGCLLRDAVLVSFKWIAGGLKWRFASRILFVCIYWLASDFYSKFIVNFFGYCLKKFQTTLLAYIETKDSLLHQWVNIEFVIFVSIFSEKVCHFGNLIKT